MSQIYDQCNQCFQSAQAVFDELFGGDDGSDPAANTLAPSPFNQTTVTPSSVNLTTTTEADYVYDVDGDPDTDKYGQCLLQPTWPEYYVFCYLLLPAIAIIIFLSWLRKRKRLWLQHFNGRPGLPFPINFIQEQHHRFALAVAFSVVGVSMLNLLFGEETSFPIPTDDALPLKYKPAYMLFSCIVYAIDYYPIFGCITCDHLIGYIIGMLYAWGLTVLYFLEQRYCWNGDKRTLILEIFHTSPSWGVLMWLCVYFPFLIYCKLARKEKIVDYETFLAEDHRVQHIRVVLGYRSDEPPVDEKKWKRMLRKIYNPIEGFKYSVAILTAVITAFTFVFRTAIGQLQYWYLWWAYTDRAFKLAYDAAKKSEWADPYINYFTQLYGAFTISVDLITVDFLGEAYFICKFTQAMWYLSFTFTLIITCGYLLMTMVNYRDNLLLIYKGQYTNFTRGGVPGGLMINYAKFVGYQIGYATWGFMIHWYLLLLVFIGFEVVCLVLFRYGQWWIVELILDKIWPVLVVLVVVMASQKLLARFCFVMRLDKQPILAIENRHFFFNFQYFSTFANIVVGLVSCLMRIILAAVFGLWMVPRLDHSTMSRAFERFDPGFNSFVGLLKLENAHNNPILVVVVECFLEAARRKKTARDAFSQGIKLMPTDPRKSTRSFQRAMINWQVFYTLHYNPGLRMYRKTADPGLIYDEKAKDSQRGNLSLATAIASAGRQASARVSPCKSLPPQGNLYGSATRIQETAFNSRPAIMDL